MPKVESPYRWPWGRVAKEFLETHPRVCWNCGELADCVDHVVPVDEAPHLRLVESNLRASCTACNTLRGRRRRAVKRRVENDRSECPPRLVF